MKKNRSLAVRNQSLVRSNPTNTVTIVIGLLAIGLIIYLLLKNRTQATSYQNAETWEVSYNEDGMPTKITIHRDAKQS